MDTAIKNNTLNIQQVYKTALIGFQLKQAAHTLLKVLNEQEEVIRVLLNETLQQGNHQVSFQHSTQQNSKYIVRLIIDDGNSIEIENTIIHI